MKQQEFDHITCKSITVTNGEDSEIRLSFNDMGRPHIIVKENSKSVMISVDDYGGAIYVNASDGFNRIHVAVGDDDRGHVLSGTKYQRSEYIPPGVP